MKYSKIQYLLDSNKNLIKKDLLKKVGKSNWGFNEMVKKRSMRVDVLEKMSEYFNVPISYWFQEEENISTFNESETTYVKLKKEQEMKALEKAMELLETELDQKNGQIKFLENQLLNAQGIDCKSKAQGE